MLALGLFAVALVVFSSLNREFDPLQDYVSKLGALGQPHALGWNLIGFMSVGVLLTGFGLAYGHFLQDRLVSILLALFGIGFAVMGVPVDLGDEGSGLSKAHIAAICLGLAAYMICLARMAHLPSFGRSIRSKANVAATILLLSIGGQVARLWSKPVTHRLVFAVVFLWVAITSISLLNDPTHLQDEA